MLWGHPPARRSSSLRWGHEQPLGTRVILGVTAERPQPGLRAAGGGAAVAVQGVPVGAQLGSVLPFAWSKKPRNIKETPVHPAAEQPGSPSAGTWGFQG